MPDNGHGDDAVAFGHVDAAHADGVAAGKDAHIVHGEADALAERGRQQHVIAVRTGFDGEDFIALLVQLHGDLAIAVDLHEIAELVAANRAACRREHHVKRFPGGLILGQRHDGGDALAGLQRQHVDQGLALGLRRADRQTPDLFLVDDATRGEEQYRRMGIGNEEAIDEILVARRHARTALAAATLRPVGGQRHTLDVAEMRNGADHVFAGDEVLIVHVGAALDNLGTTRRAELVADRDELFRDDLHDAQA
ncbi:hypothetical protein D3C72_1132370 [compost metagenome]